MIRETRDERPDTNECLLMYRNCASFNSRRASRKLTRFYNQYVETASGISAVQLPIIAALGSGRVRSLGALAQTLDLERSTLSRNVTLLERRGMVATHAGTGPKPARIALTGSGRRALATAYEAWLEAHRQLARILGEDELRKALDALHRIERAELFG